MASVKLTLGNRSARKDGTFSVKLYVSHKGKDFFISTSVIVNPKDWIDEKSEGYNPQAPTKDKLINSILKQKLIQITAQIYQLDAEGKLNSMDSKMLRSCLTSTNLINSDIIKTDKELLLVRQVFEEAIKYSTADGTKSIYAQTLSKLALYYDLGTLRFEDITIQSLREFEAYMRNDGLSVNAISVHMRNLRAVFNRAIDDEIINHYPFRKFKIKTERTIKRSLSVEQLRELRDYECQEYQQRYRDYFMLIFYLIGINMVDLASLQNINTGRIEYRRAKTGRLYSIKIEDEALKIINKYKGKKFLMDVLDTNTTHSRFLKQANEALQAIGGLEWVENAAKNPKDVKKNKKKVTPLFPDITTYWARHTWATIAASLDIPKETIAAALGHGGNTVTDIYIDFDQRKVDDANRRVIDFVNQITTTPCEEK